MQSEEHFLLKYLQAAHRVVDVIFRYLEKFNTESTHEKIFMYLFCAYILEQEIQWKFYCLGSQFKHQPWEKSR